MKILVIGQGGREHALIWKLVQSKKVQKIYAAPGNGGTMAEEKTENLKWAEPLSGEGQKKLVEFALEEKIDLTVVGPEAPLAEGIADRFREAGLKIVGPGRDAARLESSKVYSESFMKKFGVCSPKRNAFTKLSDALEFAHIYFNNNSGKADDKKSRDADSSSASSSLQQAANVKVSAPLVIKADGLAAGKGVVIAADEDEAKKALNDFMKTGAIGDAGKSVVFEEYLDGFEVSVMAAVSVSAGKGVIKPFIPAMDHKRRFEGGIGPNTGGMGAIAPVPEFTPSLQKEFTGSILEPTLKGMKDEQIDYRGFIFFGLMVVKDSCYLLEYNARLGDPETQALLPLMDSDLAELCLAMEDGTLADFTIEWKIGAVCAPVLAVEGYPGPGRKDDPIAINQTGLDKTGAKVFVAGAVRGAAGSPVSELRTTGGRTLAVSAYGNNAGEAYENAYKAIGHISFEGMVYRTDIGLKREEKSHG